MNRHGKSHESLKKTKKKNSSKNILENDYI